MFALVAVYKCTLQFCIIRYMHMLHQNENCKQI